ncbi:hypothetical protein ACWGM0_05210 [Sphingomonas bisphenolicum]
MQPDLIPDIRALLAPFLTEVEGALDRREQRYPALIEVGSMDPAAAAIELRAWSAIVADWRSIVTATGGTGNGATIEEKMAVLGEGCARYRPALAKAIANQSDAIRRDVAEISDRAYLRDRHGQAIAPYLALLESADRLAELHAIYASELPGERPWRGIWSGIAHYLDFHRQVRADRQRQKAA